MIADILERAADRVETGWHRGYTAADAGGFHVGWASPKASRFCAVGAVWKEENRTGGAADKFFREFLGSVRVGSWNDAPERTQAEVVAKLREAASVAREQSK